MYPIMVTSTTKETGNRFPKQERLCSNKSIDRLFSSGDSFVAYPLRVVFFIEDEEVEDKRYATIIISVSKRKFKRAVKRNRVKRLIREAYRLNKTLYSDILNQYGIRIDMAFLYLKDELPTYTEIEKAIQKAGTILAEKMEGKGK